MLDHTARLQNKVRYKPSAKLPVAVCILGSSAVVLTPTFCQALTVSLRAGVTGVRRLSLLHTQLNA